MLKYFCDVAFETGLSARESIRRKVRLKTSEPRNLQRTREMLYQQEEIRLRSGAYIGFANKTHTGRVSLVELWRESALDRDRYRRQSSRVYRASAAFRDVACWWSIEIAIAPLCPGGTRANAFAISSKIIRRVHRRACERKSRFKSLLIELSHGKSKGGCPDT